MNFASEPLSFDEEWENRLAGTHREGGFFLERGILQILMNNYRSGSKQYPVFIVMTDQIDKALFTKKMAEYQIMFPESDKFYVCDSTGNLNSFSLLRPHTIAETDVDIRERQNQQTLAWPDAQNPKAFLADDDQMSIITTGAELQFADISLDQHDWKSGLILRAMSQQMSLYPERAANMKWLATVKNSFSANILNPVTSFISLENEAQKAALLAKQEKVLKANSNLDLATMNRMSEPSLSTLLIILLLLVGVVRFRKRLA